jgi:hypothetical protein
MLMAGAGPQARGLVVAISRDRCSLSSRARLDSVGSSLVLVCFWSATQTLSRRARALALHMLCRDSGRTDSDRGTNERTSERCVLAFLESLA